MQTSRNVGSVARKQRNFALSFSNTAVDPPRMPASVVPPLGIGEQPHGGAPLRRRLLGYTRTTAAVLGLMCGLGIIPAAQTIGSAAQFDASVPHASGANRSLGSDPWVQFVKGLLNLYAISTDSADQGNAIVPLYTNYNAGGTYGTPDGFGNITPPDGNDPDAPPGGISSYLMVWNGSGSNGYFQFDISCNIPNTPRDISNFGTARKLRFFAKGGLTGNGQVTQVQVNVFQRVAPPTCDFVHTPIATQWFQLTTGWSEYVLDISSAGLSPQDLWAVQFLMDSSRDVGGGTARLSNVRIDTDGYDPLRGIQSYIAHWAPTNSPPNTPGYRDANIYPNRSFLYDNALAIQSLLLGGYVTEAMNIADGRLATVAGDCTNGFYNELNSGHTLLANGMSRGPYSMRKRVGDNSWFGLALLALYQDTNNSTYLTCAQQISDWVNANFKVTSGMLQGYSGGLDDNGNPLPSRSTEENSDYFELNEQLGAMYADRATWAGNFVINMYFASGPYFWAGTSMGDMVQMASVPLDAQTLPLLTLGMSQQYQNAVDYVAALRWAEANLVVTDGLFTGFTYSTQSAMQSCNTKLNQSVCPRVWLEGVAQGCVAYELLGRLEPNSPDPWGAKVQQCLQTLEDASMNGTGVVAASSDNLVDLVFNQYYDARQAMAPTAWAVHVRSLLSLR